ncbi:MAG: signal recognition particle protein, partial [Actinomycetota bacterium]|nr:signal recognition particle protein [Actinomycetota bacterium]
PGKGRKAKGKKGKAKARGGRSGNPAKRALAAQDPPDATGSPLGAAEEFALPADFTDLLPPSGR